MNLKHITNKLFLNYK